MGRWGIIQTKNSQSKGMPKSAFCKHFTIFKNKVDIFWKKTTPHEFPGHNIQLNSDGKSPYIQDICKKYNNIEINIYKVFTSWFGNDDLPKVIITPHALERLKRDLPNFTRL